LNQFHIAQKTVKYSLPDKLSDSFITMLAGAHGIIEINMRLRADPALQAAFGRTGSAEQSVVQQTLDTCTDENVTHSITFIRAKCANNCPNNASIKGNHCAMPKYIA
jgi:hypothetical protein